ncbi:lycopene cyclase domain-containing protein [Jatrophihabitans sp.]|uniref:lycopene cyclase domain-containing protein n=1 Tax=Jatrophihabitans sp. TaxID=1932789 RepID=UPI0038CD9BE8
MTYTWLVVGALLGAAACDLALLRTRLLTRRAFWTSYAIMFGFQLLVNGVLTGLGVVQYDPDTILGVRLAYAPVEDLGFGFALILLTLSCWVALGRRATGLPVRGGAARPVRAGPGRPAPPPAPPARRPPSPGSSPSDG